MTDYKVKEIDGVKFYSPELPFYDENGMGFFILGLVAVLALIALIS